MKGSRDADISFPVVEAVSLFLLFHSSLKSQSVLILGVYISSASRLMLLKHLMKLDPETRYPKHQYPKNHIV